MNRKHNPVVALVALALLAVLLFCAGCDSTTEAAEPETSPRFIVEVADAKTRGAHQHVEIITDTETGVQYIFIKSANAGGLTVLQPATEAEEATK